jgi:hypothetical protein
VIAFEADEVLLGFCAGSDLIVVTDNDGEFFLPKTDEIPL